MSPAGAGAVDLPDLNVWLALACVAHPHHRRALDYWEQEAANSVLFCTVTALGLVRLLSQPKLMGEAVKTCAQAGEVLRAFCAEPGVRIAAGELEAWDVFHGLLPGLDQISGQSSRHCTDAHLAALALAHDWRLVSFDADFQRYPALNWLRLIR
jgi:uncharacterized protein